MLYIKLLTLIPPYSDIFCYMQCFSPCYYTTVYLPDAISASPVRLREQGIYLNNNNNRELLEGREPVRIIEGLFCIPTTKLDASYIVVNTHDSPVK